MLLEGGVPHLEGFGDLPVFPEAGEHLQQLGLPGGEAIPGGHGGQVVAGGVLTADDSDYINALIAGQDDLDSVDAVSGATITSNALKQAVRYAQEAIAR